MMYCSWVTVSIPASKQEEYLEALASPARSHGSPDKLSGETGRKYVTLEWEQASASVSSFCVDGIPMVGQCGSTEEFPAEKWAWDGTRYEVSQINEDEAHLLAVGEGTEPGYVDEDDLNSGIKSIERFLKFMHECERMLDG